MALDEILELGDLNLAEATREMTRWHVDGEIAEKGDHLLAAGPDPFPVGFSNAAMALGPAAADVRLLERSRDFFGRRGRGHTVWVRRHVDASLEAACAAEGLRQLGESPGMVLEARKPETPLPAGAGFRFVGDVDGARDFASAAARSYATMGLPSAVTERTFEMPERLLRPHVIALVAYLEDAPASVAMAILSHGIAGIYWVGTVETARKRGLGEACTRLVGNAAFERGARCVVLQASQQGEPIYRRMGYREVTRYAWWVRLSTGG